MTNLECLSRMTKPDSTGPLLPLTKGCPRTHLGDLCYDCKGTGRVLLPLDSAGWRIVEHNDDDLQEALGILWDSENFHAATVVDAAHSIRCQDKHEGDDDAE